MSKKRFGIFKRSYLFSPSFVSGTLISFIGKVSGSLFGYINLLLLAKILKPDVFGLYSLSTTLLYLLTTIAVFGMDKTLLKYIPKWKKNTNDLRQELSNTFYFTVFLAIMITLVLIGFIPYISNLYGADELKPMLLIMSFSIVLQVIMIFSRTCNQAFFSFAKATIPEDIIRPISYFLLLMGLIFGLHWISVDHRYLVVSCLFVFVFLLVIICSLTFLKGNLKEYNVSFPLLIKSLPKIKRGIISFSTINLFSNFLVQSRINLIILLSGFLLPPSDVGHLYVIVRTATFISFILAAVNSVFGPSIASLFENRKFTELDDLYKKSTKWVTILGSFICLILIVGNIDILQVFGDKFILASTGLILLSLGELINISVGSVGYVLIMTGNHNINFRVLLFSLCISLILCWTLTSTFGILGSALSLAISISLTKLLNLFFAKRILGMYPFSKGQLGVAVAIIVIVILDKFLIEDLLIFSPIFNLIIIGLFSLLIYVPFIYFLSLNAEEKKSLKKLVKQN